MSDGFNNHRGDGFFGTGFCIKFGIPFLEKLIQLNKLGLTLSGLFNDALDAAFVTLAKPVQSNCGYFGGTSRIDISVVNEFPDDPIISGYVDFTPSTTTREGFLSKYVTATPDRSIRLEKTATDIEFYTCPDGTFGNMVLATIPLSSLTTGVCYFELIKNGTTATLSQDGGTPISFVGTISETIHQSDAPIQIGTVGGTWPYYGQMYGLKICVSDGTCVTNMSIGEGAGAEVNDSSGYGNNGVVVTTDIDAFWGETQDGYHSHLENGFSLYEHATLDPVYVDFLTTGTPNLEAVVPSGYTLTQNVEGTATSGAMHNGAETKILGTDSQMLASEFYSDDGLAFTARDWAFAKAFLWGATNTWGRWGLDKYDSCALFSIAQYEFAWSPTDDQYDDLVSHFTQGTCGGGVAS